MRVLNGAADVHEELEPLLCGQAVGVAVVRDRQTFNELHREERLARWGFAGLENFRDARVVHQRERLSLGLEPRSHFAGVEPDAYDLEGYVTANRSGVHRLVHNTHSALAEDAD